MSFLGSRGGRFLVFGQGREEVEREFIFGEVELVDEPHAIFILVVLDCGLGVFNSKHSLVPAGPTRAAASATQTSASSSPGTTSSVGVPAVD